jgi:hypothetical protein
MILRLLLVTGQHQHKKNWHTVWLWWLALASNLQKQKQVTCSTNKLPCIDRAMTYMLNASQELTQIWNRFNSSITPTIILFVFLVLYLPDKQHGFWRLSQTNKSINNINHELCLRLLN